MKLLVVLVSVVCAVSARPGYLAGAGLLGLGLPVPAANVVLGAGGVPLDTPEVVAARITHAAQVVGAQVGIPPAAVIPGDTPAVAAARATHLAQVAGEQIGIPSSLVIPGDTPAVAAAKVSHAAAVATTAVRDATAAALGGAHLLGVGVPAVAAAPGVLAHLHAKAALLG
ncbi:cuticle protein 18.7-like [Schistocerca cancellata]|uniref:cuticle protein 18.7-like n=1 Tax=Schistocerca cancellata TaxID=274614 RepID=UPI0021199C95|nr:cuticle protein 18.7-like [Schistocerca cancellata]